MTINPVKPPRCKVCRSTFVQYNSFKGYCSPECGAVLGMKLVGKQKRQEAAKARKAAILDRKETKEKLAKIQPHVTHQKLRAKALKAIQRARRLEELHKGNGCMSCGRTQQQVMGTDSWKTGGAWDGGHFISKGARPELAFEPLNIWLQCKSCNGGSSKYARKGYTVNASFRVSLIEAVGLSVVEWLEGPHPLNHHTDEDLIAMAKAYTALGNAIQKQIEEKA